MIDLGLVALLPWTNLYPLFDVVPTNFSGYGGYKIFDNKTYVLLNGQVTNSILLPTPKNKFDLCVIKDGNHIMISNFDGNISGSGEYFISAAYEIEVN